MDSEIYPTSVPCVTVTVPALRPHHCIRFPVSHKAATPTKAASAITTTTLILWYGLSTISPIHLTPVLVPARHRHALPDAPTLLNPGAESLYGGSARGFLLLRAAARQLKLDDAGGNQGRDDGSMKDGALDVFTSFSRAILEHICSPPNLLSGLFDPESDE
ncbi:hypothetical protein B0H11DRAFT_1907798 [Mycena galericulata]|nr:hypothetical protein B0H11DRAFT_1907798 [Mycena galericulata]